LRDLIEADRTDLPVLRANAADPTQDAKGDTSDMLGITLRGLGIFEYALYKDEAALRSRLTESVTIAISLFDRFERGEPIDASYLSMLAYKDLYDALALGDMHLARSLAQKMGGRKEIERQHNHPFDRAMGYALRAFVLRDREEMQVRTEAFRERCEKRGGKYFRGYASVFEAILEGDSRKANAGFVELLKGHRRMSTGNGVFRFTPDADLCVWGLGLANLARHHGLDIKISDPLIPSELLV